MSSFPVSEILRAVNLLCISSASGRGLEPRMKGFHAVEIESTRLSIGPSVNSGHSELRIEKQLAGYLLDAIG